MRRWRGRWCARWRTSTPALIVSSSASRAIEDAAERCGLRVATTFLADRACDDEGLLVPRKLPGAVIHDRDAVLARVRQLLDEGTVTSYGGRKIPMKVRSILLHGDTPGAVALARAVRGVVEAAAARGADLAASFATCERHKRLISTQPIRLGAAARCSIQ